MDRRAFLHRAGLTGLTLATAGALRPAARADEALAPFTAGVASGDPLHDRVVLWTRVDPPDPAADVTVEWRVARDIGLSDVVASGTAVAPAARDHTVKVDAGGLEPDTWYFYGFRALGADSLVGRTKTAPVGSPDHLRFGVVSCSNYQHGFFNVYARLAERHDLDAILHLGDYLYEYQLVADGGYGEDEADLAAPRRHDPPVEMTLLEHYRARHRLYKLDPDLRRLHQLFPFVTTWDDHESTNNSYRDGADNHDDGEGDWQQRKAWSKQAYDEWMPVRVDATQRLWRSFTYGDLAELIVLDTRLERDPIVGRQGFNLDADVSDPDRAMLGDDQRAMLYERLVAPARWKILVQQVIMAQWNAGGFPDLGQDDAPVFFTNPQGNIVNADQWDGYPAERANLWNLVQDRIDEVCNFVVLTGDVHSSWVIDLTPDPYDVTSYNPVTGEGAFGVEFVCPSVTSSGPAIVGPELVVVEQGTRADNPHVVDTNFSDRGYYVLDITPERTQADYFHVDTVLAPSDVERAGFSYFTADKDPRAQRAEAQAAAKAAAPATPEPARAAAAAAPAAAQAAPADSAGSLPATGGGALPAAALGLLGGALALRRRTRAVSQEA